jgi:hypothetical protein
MTTVTVKAILGRQADAKPAPRSTMPDANAGLPVSRTARLLALAHKVRRLLDEGRLPDQAEAAARLGWSFPQLTHILGLMYLAPEIQERILLGELVLGESALRPSCRITSWQHQVADLNRRLVL